MSNLPITLTAIVIIVLSAMIGFIIRWIWSGSGKVNGLAPRELKMQYEKSERRLNALQEENLYLKEALNESKEKVVSQVSEHADRKMELEKIKADYESLRSRSDNIVKLEQQYQQELEQSRSLLEATQARIKIIEQDNQKLRATLSEMRKRMSDTHSNEETLQTSGKELLDRLQQKISTIRSASEKKDKIFEDKLVSDLRGGALSVEAVAATEPAVEEPETVVVHEIEDEDELSFVPDTMDMPNLKDVNFDDLDEVDDFDDAPEPEEETVEKVEITSLESAFDEDIRNQRAQDVKQPVHQSPEPVSVEETEEEVSVAAVPDIPEQTLKQEEEVVSVVSPAVETVQESQPQEAEVLMQQAEPVTESVMEVVDTPVEVMPEPEEETAQAVEKDVQELNESKQLSLAAMEYLNDATFIATMDNRPSAFLDKPQSQKPDDLKKIRGVEDRLEKILNQNGVYYYHQIENLTAHELAWLDKKLKFNGRIANDDWPLQAKALRKNA